MTIALKVLLWVIGIPAILLLFWIGYWTYALDYAPYYGKKFSKEVWLDGSTAGKYSLYGVANRCGMYYDIATNHLKKGKHLNEVQELLGEIEIIMYCEDKKVKCGEYLLGVCYAGSLTISHGILGICFDKNQKIIGFGKGDYYKKVCKKQKFACVNGKCSCEKVTQLEGGGTSIRSIECPFEINKW